MSSFGKHTHNPGYKPGEYWVNCQRCGFDIPASKAMRTWDGLVVCPEDWEPRHEQDFVRAVTDNQRPRGLVSSPPADTFVSVTYADLGAEDDVPTATHTGSL